MEQSMRRVLLSLLLGAMACRFDPAGLDVVADGSTASPTDADSVDPDGEDGNRENPDATSPLPADAGIVDAAPPSPPDATPCPSDYGPDPASGHAYRLRRPRLSWPDAEAACEEDGFHLVVIDDAAELAIVDQISDVQFAWIGVNDQETEGAFVTVIGEPATFLPWNVGEPNDVDNEDCVELLGDKLNDRSCEIRRAYVCECE